MADRLIRLCCNCFNVVLTWRVAEAGGPDLADRLEEEGYDRYLA